MKHEKFGKSIPMMLHAKYKRFDPGIEVQSKRKEANEEIDENSNRSSKWTYIYRGHNVLR